MNLNMMSNCQVSSADRGKIISAIKTAVETRPDTRDVKVKLKGKRFAHVRLIPDMDPRVQVTSIA